MADKMEFFDKETRGCNAIQCIDETALGVNEFTADVPAGKFPPFFSR
jgi:hypothetical protein